MKKIIMISLILWILSLFLLYFIVNQAGLQSQDYLVNINRIQNWIETQELENLNRELELSDFSSEELGNITAVKIIDLKNLNQNTAQEFLAAELDDYRYLYRYLAGKEQLVRYQLQLNENFISRNFIYSGLLLTLIFVFFLIFYYKTEKEIMVPLKNP